MTNNEVYPQDRAQLLDVIDRLDREMVELRQHPPVKEWIAEMDCGCATLRGYGPPPQLGERLECPTERIPKERICAVSRVYWASEPARSDESDSTFSDVNAFRDWRERRIGGPHPRRGMPPAPPKLTVTFNGLDARALLGDLESVYEDYWHDSSIARWIDQIRDQLGFDRYDYR